MSLVDTSGRVLFSGQLSLPGAIVTVILGVAVSPNQQVVIAGGAKSKDGTVAPVLVWADVRGNVKTVVQTASFFPGSVAFVSEGSLIALGRENDSQLREVPGHRVLRLYAPDGKLASEARLIAARSK